MDNKVVGLPSGKDEMKAAIAQLKRNLPELVEHAKLIAEVKRAAYLAYVEQGFTEEQALELTKGSIML